MRDTSEELAERQREWMRRRTPAERAVAFVRLCKSSRALMRAGIRMRHPDYSDADVELALLRLLLLPTTPCSPRRREARLCSRHDGRLRFRPRGHRRATGCRWHRVDARGLGRGDRARSRARVRELVRVAGDALDRAYIERWLDALGVRAPWERMQTG